MSTPFDGLPWSSLELRAPDIPWQDLRVFAEAAAESCEVRQRLLDQIQTLTSRRYAGEEEVFSNLADLGVLAVFALAAERMNGEGRRQVAQSLLELLYQAGREDDDFMLEAIELAAGKLGPELIDPAIQLVQREGFDLDCWFHVFGLLSVARHADEPTRARVLRLCRRMVHEAPDRFEHWSRIMGPATVLAELGDTTSIGLLRSIYKKSRCPDLKECIDLLEGKQEPLPDELGGSWRDRPVEAWLPEFVQRTRKYLNGGEDEREENQEEEPESAEELYDELVEDFLCSSDFETLPEPAREHADFAVSSFLMYMWEHLGTPLEQLALNDVRELLLNIFPRKLSAEKDFFEQTPAILVCFLRWLGRTGRHTDVEPLCTEVSNLADEMLERSQDPCNWGLAKTVYVQAKQAGVDTSDPEAVMAYWNPRAMAKHLFQVPDPPDEDEDESHLWPIMPIHRETERIGRNEPCPCGSGKKYKKCCGK